ncbi:hypothetical protein E2562_001209 [Oryza meyeriana var. granulata]|uniref:Uncharacterized protein n=1 Tax=Oryza meyeriana var. granulata TaxID=110450 RepID=A0A6G1DC07_9ORYZ|nr:hypothetical protein E2562_001209 [Oryza meyeriana var. granulata]
MPRGRRRRGPGGSAVDFRATFIAAQLGMQCRMGPAEAEQMRRVIASSDCNTSRVMSEIPRSPLQRPSWKGLDSFLCAGSVWIWLVEHFGPGAVGVVLYFLMED